MVPGSTGSFIVAWAVGPVMLELDLATATASGTVAHEVAGMLPVRVDLTTGPSGAHVDLVVGSIDEQLGGARLVAGSAGPGRPTSAAVEWSSGGSRRVAGLWPTVDTSPLVDLVVAAVPTVAVQALTGALLAQAAGPAGAALEAGLVACGLVQDLGDGDRVVRLPVAFLLDPAAYVVGVARSASADVAAAGYDVLEAFGALVDVAHPPGSWPLADGVWLRYAHAGEALSCTLHVELDETLDGVPVQAVLDAGAVLRPGVLPGPSVDVSVRVGGTGLELRLDPDLRVSSPPGATGAAPALPGGPRPGPGVRHGCADPPARAPGPEWPRSPSTRRG